MYRAGEHMVERDEIGSGHYAAQDGRCSEAPQTPCFTAGTLIATRRGDVAVEDLAAGDSILTRDNGYRTILWIGAREFAGRSLQDHPDLQPVRIAAGALGPMTPARDLLVSPQHRMLLSGGAADMFSDDREVLVSAVDMIGLGLAEAAEVSKVIYYHILFADHEIVLANGAWSESFNPALAALSGLHQLQRQELLKIFPELATRIGGHVYPLARAVYSVESGRAAA